MFSPTSRKVVLDPEGPHDTQKRRSPRPSISPRSTSRKTIGDLNLIRQRLCVPPSMLASDLMARMQTMRMQMAL